jgi:ornithine cyclodeaminase/alanine dehydrogenase-like protein (mu-crystallin family)
MSSDAAEPTTYSFAAISAAIDAMPAASVVDAIAEGFVAYSAGRVSVPPIQTLGQPPYHSFVGHKDAQACIKSAYVDGAETFVTKVASGGGGLNSGLMLVFSQRTFAPEAILLDGGWLTELRTAAAGALAARTFAPPELECIAVVGCGIQARWQLQLLASVVRCRRVCAWARRPEQARAFAAELSAEGVWQVEAAPTLQQACAKAGLVLCVTCAREGLIKAEWLAGRDVLVTAVGADAPGKQELEPTLVASAALCVADSKSQCFERGELQHAVGKGLLERDAVVEIGSWLARAPCPPRPKGVVVFDSTGVAVQDVAIAELALKELKKPRPRL